MSDLNDCYTVIGRITVKMEYVAHLLLLFLLEHENQGLLKLDVNLDKWGIKEVNKKFRKYLDDREKSGESLPYSRKWSVGLDDMIRKRNNYVHSLYARVYDGDEWPVQRFRFEKKKRFDELLKSGQPVKIEELTKVEKEITDLLERFSAVDKELAPADVGP